MITRFGRWRIALAFGLLVTAIGFALKLHIVTYPGFAFLYSIGMPLWLIAFLVPIPPIALLAIACVVFWMLAWDRMFHLLSYHRRDFLKAYHKRSNVESTFSAIKRVFGDFVRSRKRTAQINEILLKIICHNIRQLIFGIFELGIDPDFSA